MSDVKTGESENPISVLVVDDDRTIRMLACELLGAAGFTVTPAADGTSALALLDSMEPDVVVLDVELPDIDGFELCRRLRADPRTSDVPVCMMTGHDDAASIQRAYAAGATDFVIKPPTWMILIERLHHMHRASLATRELFRANRALALAGMVFDHMPEAVVITDRDAVIVSVNPAFTAILGYEADEAIGKKPNLYKSDRHPVEFYRDLWRVLLTEGVWRGEIWDRRKSGEVFPALVSISSLEDEKGQVSQFIATVQDLTNLKENEERIYRLANFDALTGLANANLFRDRLDMATMQARREKKKLVVLMLDLDGFSKINDTIGHVAGDQILIEVSNRLRAHTRADDTVARLGGDTFLVLFPYVREERSVLLVVEKFLKALAESFAYEGDEIEITASAGVSIYPGDGETYGALIQSSDIALRLAKEGGGNRYVTSSPEFTERIRQRVGLENSLRKAIAQQRVSLHYQPRYDLRTRRISGCEALARWQENGVFIPPAEFIPIAEESGLIVPLGEHLLESACLSARRWLERGARGIVVSVNVSPIQVAMSDFAERVEAVLERTGLPPDLLELELTESVFIGNPEAVTLKMRRLGKLGVRFALDDFGTGYSSLSYLGTMPFDVLKIDRSFVADLELNENSRVIIQTILSMARVLGLHVVAEGVETEFQEEYIRGQSPESRMQGQGYLFSRPVPLESFERLIFPS